MGAKLQETPAGSIAMKCHTHQLAPVQIYAVMAQREQAAHCHRRVCESQVGGGSAPAGQSSACTRPW